jgi:hypothetical protein
MFEVTIRTDNQKELHQLLVIIKSLGIQVFKENAGNGKKIVIELPEKEVPSPDIKGEKKKIVKWGGMDVDISNIKPGFGCAKGMFEMSPDFDEPLEDFKEYMY